MRICATIRRWAAWRNAPLRVRACSRAWPRFRALPKSELIARCEALGLPFAPIARPGDLFDDPHLLASGGLLDVDLTGAEGAPGGQGATAMAGLPGLPVRLPEGRPGLRRQPPRLGADGAAVLREAGWTEAEIAALRADGTLMERAGTER